MSALGVADYTVVAIAILLASCLQASIGFGMGMLAAPVVALIDPSLIPGTLIMLAALVTLMVVIRERTAIDVRGTGWALVGRVPGTIAGALLLAAIPERALAILIACVVLVGVAVTSMGWIPAPRTTQSDARRRDLGCARHRDLDRRPTHGARLATQYRRAAARHHERLLPHRFGHVDRGTGADRCGRREHVPRPLGS